MQLLHARTPLVLLIALLAACSSGSGGGSAGAQPVCSTDDGLGFCLVSCNLGCTTAGCAITEIAQNQPIILNFNQNVDPNSVSTSTLSFRTATGEEPVGEYVVQGTTVTFVPEIRVVGGASFFGFKASQTYTMTLPAGANQLNALRSTSGDRLALPVVCGLTVSRGVIDLDGRPPAGKLLTPSAVVGAPRNTSVVVEFSELVDISAFQTSDPAQAPVVVRVRKTRRNTAGVLECDPSATAFVVPGGWQAQNDSVRQVTVATFTPLAPLPSLGCGEVVVTDNVRDLAGKQAAPNVFTFLTEDSQGAEEVVSEDFQSSLNLDLDISSGSWGGGQATPGLIGGDGLHGEFDITLGNQVEPGVFEWRTDLFPIPQSNTLSGREEVVTDGVFRFSRFQLSTGQTLRFVGSKPPQIYVRGQAVIEGLIDLSAVDTPRHAGTVDLGQEGSPGAVFAGDGGKGGDKNLAGTGPDPKHDGEPGDDLGLPQGHAYASRADKTGGRGSVEWPASGLAADVQASIGLLGVSLLTSAGGGGAGYRTAGGIGEVLTTFGDTPSDKGPPSAGGVLYNPFPLPGNKTVFDHFLIGGSGGGGGASHAFGSRTNSTAWQSASGGGGGGGPIGFRVGRDLSMVSTARINVTGGDGGGDTPNTQKPGAPGGGGSGGSVVFQLAGRAQMSGIIDASGGKAGKSSNASLRMETVGGDGAPGYIRLERPGNPSVTELGTTVPPATAENVAPLSEQDPVVGSASRWRTTGQVFPPNYVRYVLWATVDGQEVLFSDDPAFKDPKKPTLPNRGLATEGEALRFLVRGAEVTDAGVVTDPNTIRPWRRRVGPDATELSLNSDSQTGFRFLLLFDRGVGDARATRVELHYKN